MEIPYALRGRTAAPFSSTTLLYGMTETLMILYDNPALVKDTVKFFIELQTMWGCVQIEAGSDAIWFGDCNASGHLISVDDYMEYAFDSVKQYVDAYRNAGGFTFYHASEHKIGHMLAQAATGVSTLSVGPGADLAVVKREVGNKVCIMGNVDPINMLLNGSPEDVRRESIRVIETGKQGGGYIFSSGEMVPRDVPEENMRAMLAVGREFGRYPHG